MPGVLPASPPDTAARRAAGLRRLRIARGWGLDYLGSRIGRDKASLSRYENERRPPPPAWVIAAAFGVTVTDVLAPCGHCNYEPPPGYQCLECGTKGKGQWERH